MEKMKVANLLCVKGELKGLKFNLDKSTISIGRAPANDINIPDPSVSRFHCEIHKVDDRYIIKDRESANGILVNGIRVKEKFLLKNDTIQIGSILLFFNSDLDLKFTPLNGHLIIIAPAEQETIQIGSEIEKPPSRWERESKKLFEFLKLFSNLFIVDENNPTSESLVDIMGILKDLFDADSLILLLWESGLKTWQPLVSISPMHEISTSKTVINQVFYEKKPVLSNCSINAQITDDTINKNLSIIAAPLLRKDQCLGVIYLQKQKSLFYEIEDLYQLNMLAQLLLITIDIHKVSQQFFSMKADLKNTDIIMKSDELKSVFSLAEKASQVNSTVLILGETGVGKEIVASFIHENSPRKDSPFVVVNCASIPNELFENELFGHEKGSYTGAYKLQQGKIEIANRGTLFFDEVGEMNPSMQAKILRFLQDKIFYRVGGNVPLTADVRIITATNRNLFEMIQKGEFREDLLYRINVMQINIPPLRNRKSDIFPLAMFFLQKFNKEFKRQIIGFSDEAILCLERYPWKGNVRELENAVERAVLLTDTPLIQPGNINYLIINSKEQTYRDASGEIIIDGEVKQHTLRDIEKNYIKRILDLCNWNQNQASEILGIHRNTLRNKIVEYQFEHDK